MNEPPRQMRKGFDASLARALKTTKQTLFVDYRSVLPEAAAQVVLVPDHASPPIGADSHAFPQQTVLGEILAMLNPNESERVMELALRVGFAANDARREEFERLFRLYITKVERLYGPLKTNLVEQWLAKLKGPARNIPAGLHSPAGNIDDVFLKGAGETLAVSGSTSLVIDAGMETQKKIHRDRARLSRKSS